MKSIRLILSAVMLMCMPLVNGQETVNEELKALKSTMETIGYDITSLQKAVDDLAWYNRVGDVAMIDKVYITGPPIAEANVKNPTAMGARNPVKFYSYIFIPKDLKPDKKYPLLVFPHGGVHGDFNTYYAHIIRELMAQQYIVIAPEYRGSTGYGKDFYEKIDYGGLENEDVNASRNYMVRNWDIVDSTRVGILGWSHGGMISLMCVFGHPELYSVCFAGVPVSDLVARMGYSDDEYRKLFSASYHIGKDARENILEYKKRSPAWNAQKLKTPLLIHSNTNDDDVNVLEVEHLIKSLKAEGKQFSYEIFREVEGGHSFDRIDTRVAREIRLKIYSFLDKYLDPPKKIKTLSDINKAAYLHR